MFDLKIKKKRKKELKQSKQSLKLNKISLERVKEILLLMKRNLNHQTITKKIQIKDGKYNNSSKNALKS